MTVVCMMFISILTLTWCKSKIFEPANITSEDIISENLDCQMYTQLYEKFWSEIYLCKDNDTLYYYLNQVWIEWWGLETFINLSGTIVWENQYADSYSNQPINTISFTSWTIYEGSCNLINPSSCGIIDLYKFINTPEGEFQQNCWAGLDAMHISISPLNNLRTYLCTDNKTVYYVYFTWSTTIPLYRDSWTPYVSFTWTQVWKSSELWDEFTDTMNFYSLTGSFLWKAATNKTLTIELTPGNSSLWKIYTTGPSKKYIAVQCAPEIIFLCKQREEDYLEALLDEW